MKGMAATLVLSLLLAGCATRASLPPGAINVPTDDGLVNAMTPGVICVGNSVPPFVGILEGDPMDAAWPIWLRAEGGRRMYMTWPGGFSVRFDPDATLLDENGKVVLAAGSPFTFEGVAHDPSKGTREEPYIAEGLWETGLARAPHCYHRPAEMIRDVRALIAALGIALGLAFAIALVLTGPSPEGRRY